MFGVSTWVLFVLQEKISWNAIISIDPGFVTLHDLFEYRHHIMCKWNDTIGLYVSEVI